MATKIKCKVCREFFPKDAAYRRGLAGICSSECYSQFYVLQKERAKKRKADRKKRAPYSRSRLEPAGYVKDEIHARDGFRCRKCGSRGFLHVHHIRYRSEFSSANPSFCNDLHNLILLCDGCHQMVHSNKKYWQPILLATMWIHYVQGRFLSVSEVEKQVAE